MASRLDLCRCYVKRLDAEAQFMLRWGAHDLSCPAYRRSGDSVDALHDELTREHLQPKHDAAFKKHGPCKEWSVFAATPHGSGSHVCKCDDSCEHRAGIHRCKDCFARWKIRNPFTNMAQAVIVE